MRTLYISIYLLLFAAIGIIPQPAHGQEIGPGELDINVTMRDEKASLIWTFSGQLSSYGFTVERRDGLGKMWDELDFVNEGLCANGVCSYQYVDRALPSGIDGVYYRVKVHVNSHESWYTRDVLLALNAIQPSQISLLQNYPNPIAAGTAGTTTAISYQLPEAMHVVLEVYASDGKEIATLVNEYKPQGTYTEQFNARTLPSGVYFYRLSTPQTQIVKRMIVQK